MRRLLSLHVCSMLTVLAVGCGNPGSPAPAASGAGTEAVPRIPEPTPFASCAVTAANGSTPPGERPSKYAHGNGALWTQLWPEGTVVATRKYIRRDGSIDMKFPWWRAVKGTLKVEGKRLDAKAPPLQAEIPDGYGESGFQATGLIFPTEGCWEVTGSAGSATLTFVTRVVKSPR